MLFDDFPAEEAREVIDLANKKSANSFTPELNNNQSDYTKNLANNQKEIASIRRPVPSTAAQEIIQTNTSSLASGKFFFLRPLCFNLRPFFLLSSLAFWLYKYLSNLLIDFVELPIARRASLHRFLEKRKDR